MTSGQFSELRDCETDALQLCTKLGLQPADLELLRDAPSHAILAALARLLRQQHRVDVRQHSTCGDGHRAQQLAQLLVVTHCQLDVARYYTVLLVVSCGISCQFQYLETQIHRQKP